MSACNARSDPERERGNDAAATRYVRFVTARRQRSVCSSARPRILDPLMKLTVVRTVWSSILVSTLILLVVVLDADFDRHVELDPTAFGAIVAVAVLFSVVTLVVPGRLHRAAVARLSLPTEDVPVPDAANPDYRRPAATERVFRDPPAARLALLRAFHPPFLLGVALAQGVAAMGVIVALGRLAPSSYALPFFVVAWMLLALRFPSIARVLEPARRLHGASLGA